jgi:signal transduction histidine kinase
MPSARRKPLKLKLAFFATLLVIFVASSLSFYIRRGQEKAIIEGQKTSRLDTVKGLRQVARESILVDDDTGMVNFVNLLRKSLSTSYAMVLYEDGGVRVHTDPTLIGSKLDDPATIRSLENRDRQEPLTQTLSSADGKNIIDISIPIIIGTNPPEYKGVARVGFDKETIDREIAISLREVDSRIKRAFLFALILGVFGAFFLAAFITRPIETLRRGAQEIGKGNLAHRIDVGTNDELKELAEDFNLMAQKLGELDEMKQDFVANVTHELRSPMTSIRGYMDLLLQGAAGNLTEVQKDYLSVIKNSAVRLGRFIDNLLDVAKIESKKLKLTPESMDIAGLTHEMQVLFKPQLDEKLKALGELWKSEKGERMKEPQGRQLIKFASQVHARQARGEGGKDAGSNNNGRGSKPVSGGIKTFDDWERVHGPITRSTQIPSSVRNKWSREDQQRWYAERKAPAQSRKTPLQNDPAVVPQPALTAPIRSPQK